MASLPIRHYPAVCAVVFTLPLELSPLGRDDARTGNHTTVYRWIQAYAPELDKRCRVHLKPTNDSWRVDETYIEVKGEWKYLYRSVDSQGNTLDFMLSAKRDAKSTERFFLKALKAAHNIMSGSIAIV